MDAPLSDSQALPAGTRIEEFVIEKVLGAGGFGITYLARDTSLGRQVVIKENLPTQFAWRETVTGTVRPRHTGGGDADDYQWSMNNFLREAETIASLDHPGIVRVLRKFEANGTAYFVMPYVEGLAFDTLIEDRRSKNSPFSEEELRGLLERMLDALGYLHERGIYHRDIKPGNILISNDGIPVLIDFGSARQRFSERSMTVLESAGYTPFEQLQSRGNVGPWSDIYAIGASVIRCITFTQPPKANDRIRNDPHVPLVNLPELKAAYSLGFLQSIDKAFAVVEEDRWQSTTEWTNALCKKPAFEEVMPQIATIPQPRKRTIILPHNPSRSSEKVGKKSRNRATWTMVGLAAAVIVGCFFLLRGGRGKQTLKEVVASAESKSEGDLVGKDPVVEIENPSPEKDRIDEAKRKAEELAKKAEEEGIRRENADLAAREQAKRDAEIRAKKDQILPLSETEAQAMLQRVRELIIQKWYAEAFAVCDDTIKRCENPEITRDLIEFRSKIVAAHLTELASRKSILALRYAMTIYQGYEAVSKIKEVAKTDELLSRRGKPEVLDGSEPYLVGDVEWKPNESGYIINKYVQTGNCANVRGGNWETANLKIHPGCSIEGGVLHASHGAIRFMGTREAPIFVKGCTIECDYTASVSATWTVFVGCSFRKAGGWHWNEGFSAKWDFGSCIMHSSSFENLSRIDNGIRISNLRSIRCKYPARIMNLDASQNAANELRGHWNIISKCLFENCSLDSSFVWSTSECGFSTCEVVGDSRTFSSSVNFPLKYSVVGDPTAFETAVKAKTQINGPGKVVFELTTPSIDYKQFATMMPLVPSIK